MKRRQSRAPGRVAAAKPPAVPRKRVAPLVGRPSPEELQRINEELAVSQEELESSNDELQKINEELAARNAQLHALNDELHNLQLNANSALVVLDGAGSVRRFTPLGAKPFNLRPADVGRPLSDIRHHLRVPARESAATPPVLPDAGQEFDLAGMARDVINTAMPRSLEVQDGSGRWFSLSARPYITLEHKIDGAVLILADIDALKRSERAASAAREYAEATLRTARDPLLVLRADLCVNTASEAYYKLFGTTPATTEGRSFWALDGGQWKNPRLRDLLQGVLPRHSFFDNLEIIRPLPGQGARTLLLNARPLNSTAGTTEMILLGIEDITERLRLDEAVRLNEERFRALAQASAQIIWTANADGLAFDDSPAWREFTGQTYPEWCHRGWLDAVHPHDRADTSKRWEECVGNQSLYQAEYRVRRADGVYRWAAMRAVPVFTRENGVREWVGTATDITETRRAGALQTAQKEAYELTLKGAPIEAVLDVLVRTAQEQSADGGRTAIFVVDSAGASLGIGATAGMTPDFCRAVDGLRIDPSSPSCGTAAFTGKNVIVRDVAQDPAWYPYRALARAHDVRACWSLPVRSFAGKVVGTYAVYHSVPKEPAPGELEGLAQYATAAGILIERHLAEAALLASEERYRTLFNSIDEGFCLVELRVDAAGRPADYRFLEVNPAFEKQCGLRNATGHWISELVPDLEPHWLEAIGEVALTGRAARFEERFQAFDRWLDVYMFRVGDASSRVVAVLFSDTTERRRKGEELERAHDAAIKASRAKDDFLAMVSHELRTPLSPVLLLASEAAHDQTLPDQTRADFAAIRTSIALEARLIDDLLDLTRVTHGKLRLERQACNLENVVRDAITVVAADVEAKQIQLVLNLRAPGADVMGDPVRLQQVFWNVLRNAVHFTPHDGRIEVESRTDPAAGTVTVAIRDSGIGIAPEDLVRIFDRFAQGDVASGASPRRGGLGLGLAISRTMVELHGGSIHATSRGRGQGATIVVAIPLRTSGPADAPIPAPVVAATGAASPVHGAAGAPRQVLLVDDHAPTRAALRRLLERRNFVVLTAASLAEARIIGMNHAVDILISDLGLPDGDGRTLLLELRARLPALQGIALSGYGLDRDLTTSRQAGFSDHLIKPVTVAMVEQSLAKLLSGAPTAPGDDCESASQL